MEEDKWEQLRVKPGETALYDIPALLAELRAELLAAIQELKDKIEDESV